MKKPYFLLLVLMAASCVNDQSLIDEMDEIKHTGDSNPTLAMEMLDSVRTHLMSSSEYVRKKCELLDTRLRDKAYITHTNDSLMRELVPYFEERDNNRDKQEAYYYAGSVYRDLQDTPRALEYFLKAEQTTEMGEYDSTMLCNTYSNLYGLYYKTLNYNECLVAAQKEKDIAEKLNILNAHSLIQIGVSLLHLRQHSPALESFDQAYALMSEGSPNENFYAAFILLSNYSYLGEFSKAEDLYKYIKENYPTEKYINSASRCLNIGRYFRERNQPDSAKLYYQRILEINADTLEIYDAARHLFLIENERRNINAACKYAATFVSACERLNLDVRQRMAATVNNQFKYYRNAEAEKRLIEDSESRKRWLIIVLFSSLFAITLISAIYNHIRKCQYKVIIEQSEELMNMEEDRKSKEAELNDTKERLRKKENELANTEKRLKEEVSKLANTEGQLKEKEDLLANTEERLREKEDRLTNTEEQLRKKKDKLANTEGQLKEKEGQLAEMNRKCEEYDKELKRKDTEIKKRIKQAYTLLGIIAQSQMAESAQSIMPTLKRATNGEHKLTKEEWQKVYAEINSLYPDFKDEIIHKYKSLSEDMLKVCYLVRIGMGNLEIRNAANLPKTTVWRYIHKFRETLEILP